MALNQANFASLLQTSGENEFILKLLPSATTDYLITQVLEIPATIPVSRLVNLRIKIEGTGASPDLVRLVNSAPKGSYNFPDYILKLDRNVEETLPSGEKIFRMSANIVVDNLLLDGNWQWKLDQYHAPAHAQGYKNAPLLARASTGKISRVIVRNFGAVGYVPWSHFGGVAGVETFPLRVGGDDVGQVPPPGQRRPWEIVDCEVHGFKGEYAGYTTEVMIESNVASAVDGYTPEWARTDVNRRVAIVRNVQYRSESDGAFMIAMGNAGFPNGQYDSGRTTFTDSTVVNTSLGYNVDTGKVVGVDIQNNLGLGIWWWANLNSVASGWNDHFDISRNAVRFGPRARYPMFRAFCWESMANLGKQYTDPALVIGRQVTNNMFALVRIGSVNNLTISANQMTTIPAAHFDETGAVGMSSGFQLFEKMASRPNASCEENPANYVASLNVTNGLNYASYYAQDFGDLYLVSTNGSVAVATTASFPAAQALNPVLTDMDPLFFGITYNFGRICRVIPQTSPTPRTYSWKTSASAQTSQTFTDQALQGALEVSMGTPVVGSSSVRIPARMMLQAVATNRSAAVVNKRIWLQVGGLTTWTGHLATDELGVGEFTVPVNTAAHGELVITAFHDPLATTGPAGTFSEYKVAYARGTFPIGTVVSVQPVISVAQDRREGGVQEGRIRFERTGSLGSALPVNFSLSEVAGRRPATLGTDFTLAVAGLGEVTASGTSGTVTFPVDVAAVEVRVIPVADEVIEKEHAWFTLQPGANHAVSGAKSKASVYLYDGPRWTLFEISHALLCGDSSTTTPLRLKPVNRVKPLEDSAFVLQSVGPDLGSVRAVGVSGLLTAGGAPSPILAANAVVFCPSTNAQGVISTVSGEVGARWGHSSSVPLAFPSFVFDAANPPFSPVVTGLSDQSAPVFPGYARQTSGFDRALKAWQGSTPGNPSSWSYLPVPPGGGWLTEKSRALCISPNGTYIGGYATRTQSSPAVQEQMAVYWSGTTMSPLFSEAALALGRSGEARAVNNSGEFVGSRKLLNSAGLYIPKAFRSEANGVVVDSDDFLIPPPQSILTAIDVPSEAIAISARNGIQSGIAVGWAQELVGNSMLRRPAVWWPRTDGQTQPNAEWLKISGRLSDSTGQANAVDSFGNVYGWVRMSAVTDRRAARWELGWKNHSFLDDQFEVYGFSDQWDLEEFVDATDKELILGNGKKNGSSRAFLLVPQAVAN